MRTPQIPFEERRGEIERTRAFAGGVLQVHGFVSLTSAGEVLVDVKFPVWFTEKPAFSCGGELDLNQVVVAGEFPSMSVMVKHWELKDQAEGQYYVGAQLIIVVTGPVETKTIAHWQVTGNALNNPLLSTESTEEVL